MNNNLKEKYRSNNPAGQEDQMSFQEMIDETWKEGKSADEPPRLKDLFAKVTEQWGFTPVQFRDFMIEREVPKVACQRTVTDTFFRTLKGKGPSKVNMRMLCELFEVANGHRLKFYQIARGERLNLEILDETLEALIGNRDDRENRTQLMHMMHDASGMTSREVAEHCGVSRELVDHWLEADHSIRDTAHVDKLLQIYLSPHLYGRAAKTKEIRDKARAILADLPYDIDLRSVIKGALTAKNPAQTLYEGIFGEKSVTGITHPQAAEKLEVTPMVLWHKLCGNTSVDEDFARRVAECIGAPEDCIEDVIEIFTGIPNTPKLIEKVKKGDLSFPAAATLMRERKGIKQRELSPNDFTQRSLSIFENGKPFSPRNAVAHANLFWPKDKRTKNGYYWHVSCAGGYDPLTPKEIGVQLSAGKINGRRAIEQLIAFQGKSWTQFFEEHDMPKTTLMRRIDKRKVEPYYIKKFEDLLGLKEGCLEGLGTFFDPSQSRSPHAISSDAAPAPVAID